MEGAHDAIGVYHLPSNAQVGAHMKAVCSQCIELLVCSPVYHYVMSININSSDALLWNLLGSGDIIPAVGIRRGRFSDIFFADIKLALDEEMRPAKLEIVGEIDDSQSEGDDSEGKPLVVVQLMDSFTK